LIHRWCVCRNLHYQWLWRQGRRGDHSGYVQFCRPARVRGLSRADAQAELVWQWIDRTLNAVEASGERWCEAEVHRTAGEIALKSPHPDLAKAEAYFESALAVAHEQQAKSWELRAAMSMARLWRDQGKSQQAGDLLTPIYGWFTEGFDTLDLRESKTLLDDLAS
jgi:predicted ATPase